MSFTVAIDGTLASGKGTLAKKMAEAFGFHHMDSGLLYRAVGKLALDQGIDLETPETNISKLQAIALSENFEKLAEADLRTPEVATAASKVAPLPQVRAALLERQKTFAARRPGAVLDGRDIGTVVCPDAPVKLWIDAQIEERARRRHLELEAGGSDITYQEILFQLEERDERDRTRAISPMEPAKDAHLIDTTSLSIEAAAEVAFAIIDKAYSAFLEKKS